MHCSFILSCFKRPGPWGSCCFPADTSLQLSRSHPEEVLSQLITSCFPFLWSTPNNLSRLAPQAALLLASCSHPSHTCSRLLAVSLTSCQLGIHAWIFLIFPCKRWGTVFTDWSQAQDSHLVLCPSEKGEWVVTAVKQVHPKLAI